MKDSYSLDADDAGLAKAYDAHKEAYCRIFDRCELRYHVVESDPGMMGGAGSHEFMAPSPAGEDEIALCANCGYAANVELARGIPVRPNFPDWDFEEVPTPNARTVADVSALLGIDPALVIKSLCYVANGRPVLALVRGDQSLHEKKLARVLGAEVRPAHPEEVPPHFGAPVGFLGPVGVKVSVIADECLRDGVYVAGANREGFHLRGVRPGRDFTARFADLHAVQSGEKCGQCGGGLTVEPAIEVGNIFKLGTKYSVPLRAMFLDETGQERPIVMGSYGIGPARIAAAAVEQSNDADGIIWPWSIAPCQIHVLPVNAKDQAQAATAEMVYAQLGDAGYEVLLDDRDERAGVKFKDADLVGIPIRVTVGTALVKAGVVEVRARKAGMDRQVRPGEVLAAVKDLAQELTRA